MRITVQIKVIKLWTDRRGMLMGGQGRMGRVCYKRERVVTGARGMLMGGQRRVEKALS